jgi:hypothetical protein
MYIYMTVIYGMLPNPTATPVHRVVVVVEVEVQKIN